METHVLISFDENVENNLICSPQEKSKKSHDLSAVDQVATEREQPWFCFLDTDTHWPLWTLVSISLDGNEEKFEFLTWGPIKEESWSAVKAEWTTLPGSVDQVAATTEHMLEGRSVFQTSIVAPAL